MAFELERVLYETEDFLRRAIGSPSLREAKKRRFRRKMEEYGRRARRSGFVFIGLIALLLAVSIYAGGIGFFAWLLAIPLAMFFATLLMFQPTRHQRRAEAPVTEAPHSLPLNQLALRAEERLLDAATGFPATLCPPPTGSSPGCASSSPISATSMPRTP